MQSYDTQTVIWSDKLYGISASRITAEYKTVWLQFLLNARRESSLSAISKHFRAPGVADKAVHLAETMASIYTIWMQCNPRAYNGAARFKVV